MTVPPPPLNSQISQISQEPNISQKVRGHPERCQPWRWIHGLNTQAPWLLGGFGALLLGWGFDLLAWGSIEAQMVLDLLGGVPLNTNQRSGKSSVCVRMCLCVCARIFCSNTPPSPWFLCGFLKGNYETKASTARTPFVLRFLYFFLSFLSFWLAVSLSVRPSVLFVLLFFCFFWGHACRFSLFRCGISVFVCVFHVYAVACVFAL